MPTLTTFRSFGGFSTFMLLQWYLLDYSFLQRPSLGLIWAKLIAGVGLFMGKIKLTDKQTVWRWRSFTKRRKLYDIFLEMKNWDEKWRNGAGKKAKTDRKSYYPISVDCWLSCAKTLPCFYLTSCLPSLDLFCLSLSPSSEKRTFISYWHNLSFSIAVSPPPSTHFLSLLLYDLSSTPAFYFPLL
jgi:hypothetical protein